jgi:hypothetical protein
VWIWRDFVARRYSLALPLSFPSKVFSLDPTHCDGNVPAQPQRCWGICCLVSTHLACAGLHERRDRGLPVADDEVPWLQGTLKDPALHPECVISVRQLPLVSPTFVM